MLNFCQLYTQLLYPIFIVVRAQYMVLADLNSL